MLSMKLAALLSAIMAGERPYTGNAAGAYGITAKPSRIPNQRQRRKRARQIRRKR